MSSFSLLYQQNVQNEIVIAFANVKLMFTFALHLLRIAIAKSFNMKSENKKNRKTREKKEPVAKRIISNLSKHTLGYGKLAEFADRADLDYNTIHSVKTTGLATPSTLLKIQKALAA